MATEGLRISAGDITAASKPVPSPVPKSPSQRTEADAVPEKRPVENRKKLDPEFLERISQELNDEFRIFNTALSFSVDDNTGRTVIKILDQETEKVVREIPTDDMLRIAAKLTDAIGRIVDETA